MFTAPGTTTNWYSPSYSPDTRLFYVNASYGFSIGYLMPDPETDKVEDHQGGGNTSLWSENMLLAIDYQTGKIRWSRVRSGGESGKRDPHDGRRPRLHERVGTAGRA